MKCSICGAEVVTVETAEASLICNAPEVVYFPVGDGEAVGIVTPNGERTYGSLSGNTSDAVGWGYTLHTCGEELPYALLLCAGEAEQEWVLAFLRESAAEMIERDINGLTSAQFEFTTIDGRKFETGIVDSICKAVALETFPSKDENWSVKFYVTYEWLEGKVGSEERTVEDFLREYIWDETYPLYLAAKAETMLIYENDVGAIK